MRMATTETHNKMLWAGAIILALVFLGSGAMKLLASDQTIPMFEDWGYPGWFNWVIGVLEVTAGAFVLWPRTAFFAAAALVGNMTGAFITHLVHSEWSIAPLPLALGVLAVYVAWGRRPAWLARRS